MKRSTRYSLLGLVLVLALALGPLAALAQDGLKLEEYVSEDGLLTVSYPEEWVIQENGPEIGMPGVIIANNEGALEAINDPASDGPAEDQQVVVLMLLPADVFVLMGSPLPEEADAEELTAAVIALFLGLEPDLEDVPEDMTVSEIETIELSEDREAGYVTVSESYMDSGFVIFEAGEGIVAFAFAAAAPGGYDEALAEITLAFAASIEYTGTADDLMNFLMGGGLEEEVPMVLDGEMLVIERCSVCHGTEQIAAKDLDEAGWTAIVDEMIGYGAQLDAEERDTVIEYLVGAY